MTSCNWEARQVDLLFQFTNQEMCDSTQHAHHSCSMGELSQWNVYSCRQPNTWLKTLDRKPNILMSPHSKLMHYISAWLDKKCVWPSDTKWHSQNISVYYNNCKNIWKCSWLNQNMILASDWCDRRKVRTAAVPATIPTGYILDTSLESYYYPNVLCKFSEYFYFISWYLSLNNVWM